jgi:cytoskeletal protein CcmA (bactofilin family)
MGSLSNLYVSQSYQSLLHLASDTNITGSTGYISVEDGKGFPLGFAISSSGNMLFSQSVQINKNLSVDGNFDVDGNFIVSGTFDIEGKVTVNDNVRINGNLEVSGSTKLTGSLEVSNAITASNAFITNDLIVSGTISAFKLVTTVESASVIFSSGSNILGDATNDIQTLNGTTIMSGSSSLTGSMGITGNLNVLGNISSSTISGIGNVTTYSASVQSLIFAVSSSISGTITTLSQSVDSRLDFLEGPFSTSVDFRLDELENWSSSLQTNFVTTAELTQTASFLQNQINQKLNTSSFNAYTSSTNVRLNNLESTSASLLIETANLELFSASTLTRLNVIETTYATTGSNTFNGNQTINGTLLVSSSMVYSGSVRGQVFPITISSNTASMNCNLGNFFTLILPAGSTRLEATNIQPGETLSLRILNSTSGSQLTGSSAVKFPTGFTYIPTNISASTDIITFLSFDTASIFAVAANYFA